MSSKRVVLSGTGVYIPDPVISNEELVDSFNAWVSDAVRHPDQYPGVDLRPSSTEFILRASGIEERHVIDKSGILDPKRMVPHIPERDDNSLSVQAEFALRSAERALAKSGLDASAIDMVICACAHHQRPYPAIAIEVQQALGTSGGGFDMNVACSATTFGLHVATGLVRSGAARHVLVTSPEIMSGHLNWRDRETHFIFGDASASAIVSDFDRVDGAQERFEIVDTEVWTRFSSNIRSNFGFLNRADEAGMGKPDKLVTQAGNKVFKDVTIAAESFMSAFLARNGLSAGDLARYWLHQANKRMNSGLMKRILGREPRPDEMPFVLEKYGNTAAPGSLIAFHEHSGDLPAGALGMICSYGAGYSIGGLLLRRD
jgi:beta-ketodecanoyl-[acyl-carrier-protein] synthase